MLILAVIKFIVPITSFRRSITRVLMGIGENWISVNSSILQAAGSIDWQSRGMENLKKDSWYLVMVNHQTWVDILVLQQVFNRRIPFLKFFIKQQLVWFPVLGVGLWYLYIDLMMVL